MAAQSRTSALVGMMVHLLRLLVVALSVRSISLAQIQKTADRGVKKTGHCDRSKTFPKDPDSAIQTPDRSRMTLVN